MLIVGNTWGVSADSLSPCLSPHPHTAPSTPTWLVPFPQSQGQGWALAASAPLASPKRLRVGLNDSQEPLPSSWVPSSPRPGPGSPLPQPRPPALFSHHHHNHRPHCTPQPQGTAPPPPPLPESTGLAQAAQKGNRFRARPGMRTVAGGGALGDYLEHPKHQTPLTVVTHTSFRLRKTLGLPGVGGMKTTHFLPSCRATSQR